MASLHRRRFTVPNCMICALSPIATTSRSAAVKAGAACTLTLASQGLRALQTPRDGGRVMVVSVTPVQFTVGESPTALQEPTLRHASARRA